jgi:hypothetical protein
MQGLAFQLIDDVLDFTGTSASLGKGSLSDIRHVILTVPNFCYIQFPLQRLNMFPFLSSEIGLLIIFYLVILCHNILDKGKLYKLCCLVLIMFY